MTEEKLKKLIEEGKVVIDESGRLVFNEPAEIINISQEPMKPNRDDRKTVINGARSSNIMLGKQGIVLGNGDFVNVDEILNALNEAISNTANEVIYATKTGKILDPKDIIEMAAQVSGKIVILDKENPNFTNVENRQWGVVSAGEQKYLPRGVLILSKNNRVQLPSGEYVSLEEIQKALDEYMAYKPKEEEPIVPERNNSSGGEVVLPKVQQSEEIYATIKKVEKVNWGKIALALLLIASTAKSIPINNDARVEASTVIEEKQEVQEEKIDFVDYSLGDKYYLPAHLKLQETSIGGNVEEIGKDWKESGLYALSGFALVSGDKIIDYIQDFDLQTENVDLEEFVDKVCKEKGLTPEDFEVMLHFGTNLDGSRAGWVNIKDFHKMTLHEAKYITQKSTVRYDGTAPGFSGVVALNTSEGKVKIPIKNDDGQYYEEGSTVIGNDGRLYIIEKIEKDDNTAKFAVKSALYGTTFFILVDGIAKSIKTKKENEESARNKIVMKFENKRQFHDFIKEFQESKKRYDKSSKFGKLLSRLSYRESFDLLQRMTPEQVNEMLYRITNIHTSDYSYNSRDKINFINGKIVIEYPDGKRQDITDLVKPIMEDIATQNPGIEGLYEEEISDDEPKL